MKLDKNVLENFLGNDINFDGPSLIIAGISLIVAIISIFVSANSYSLSKKVFQIGSKRLAYDGAETHVRNIFEVINSSKSIKSLDSEALTKKSKNQMLKYAESFDRKYNVIFTNINISCSAFTASRSLADEAYADINIGQAFLDFVRPHYKVLSIIKENDGKYGDLLLLYNLWDIKRRMRKVDKKMQYLEVDNAKIDKESLKIYASMVGTLLKFYFKGQILGDENSKDYLKEAIKHTKELQKMRTNLKSQIKEVRTIRKEFWETERMLRKQMQQLRPLGL